MPIAEQPMRAVEWFELCAVVQDLDDLPQLVEILAAPSGPLEVAFELPRRADGPHQRWAAFRVSISGHSLKACEKVTNHPQSGWLEESP
jgi:hypothetical protein